MRTFGACKAGFHGTHVQFQTVAEHRFLTRQTPQALSLAIRLDQLDGLVRTTGQTQVVQRHLIDREETTGRAVLRCHVGNGRPVCQWQISQAVAVELDKLADHTFLAQHLGDGQHQIGGGDAFFQFAGQPETDDFRDQHRHWLAKHRRLGFDPTHAPAQHAKAIDHRGVRIGADQGVGERVSAAVFFLGPHSAAQVFEVHLMANAGAGRHYAEVIESALAPTQERVALTVALHLDVDVLAERFGVAKLVDHHRVVDDQVHRGQRVDALRVTTSLGHGSAHGGQIDHCRHTGEVLHQHAGRAVLNFPVRTALGQPVGNSLEVVASDGLVVLPTQQVFQQHFE
ncbi:Uncharacterized protein AC509_4607 [Pseudomonas amygdali pv. morsprunorum]|nr:Uncharacterized protein AC509_4607 [Pseudomonas amygdali pv. morsprunorum]